MCVRHGGARKAVYLVDRVELRLAKTEMTRLSYFCERIKREQIIALLELLIVAECASQRRVPVGRLKLC